MIRHALPLCFAISLSACTIVQVQGGSPSTSVHFGILKIEPSPGARSLSFRIRGIGVVPGTSGVTLGIAQEDAVLAYHPEDCRLVVFDSPRTPAERRAWYEQLGDPAMCRTGG